MPHHDITHLGKGAVRDPLDPRDFKFADHPTFGAALAAVDWNVPFFNPEPPSNDQNGSGSCVGQAWSYYHQQLKGKDFSRRYLYAIIRLPQGGANIRDGGLRIVNVGQATRDVVPDPSPETEEGMSDKTGINDTEGASDRELDSFSVAMDIDHWAAAIKAYKGIVGGLEGRDEDWTDLANPNPPPKNLISAWGHCLYFFAYHMHENPDGTKTKCVIAKSSWGDAGNTTVHHIKQNYFDSGFMFNAWTLIPRNTSMQYDHYKIFHKATGREGVLVVGQTGFSDAIIWAKDAPMLAQLMADFEIPADAPTITL